MRSLHFSIHRRHEDGAVAVEFALIFPLLAMILLGTVTAGLSYTHSIGLTNAVREGSRFGATAILVPASGWNGWAADVVDRTRATQFDDNTTTPETRICAAIYKKTTSGASVLGLSSQCDAAIGYSAAPVLPTTVETGKCVVMVHASRPFTITAVLFNADEEMKKKSVSLYERVC